MGEADGHEHCQVSSACVICFCDLCSVFSLFDILCCHTKKPGEQLCCKKKEYNQGSTFQCH